MKFYMKFMAQLVIILAWFGMAAMCGSSDNRLSAILLSTSKFWFNYRQATNVLMIYQTLKKYGVKDEDILLLIPENTACNSRNNEPGIVSPYDGSSTPNLFRDIEIDYK